MRFRHLVPFLLILPVLMVDCELEDDKLSSVLSELIDVRSELHELFKSPSKKFDDETPDEFVVHVSSVSEADWIANMTNTRLVGPMRGFSDLYVFKSYSSGNQSEVHRIRRDLHERQQNAQLYWSELQQDVVRQKRDILSFNDPMYEKQWQFDHHRISDAWASGYTGQGIVVSILDDGVDYKHKDLEQNYEPLASYDLNGNDDDITPTYDEFNKHGTRCAGEVAMLPNNSICGVGVAFDSKIGGIRMLDGKVNDRLEAEALSMLVDHVDILSSSWGPTDDGKTVEGPGKLASMGLQKGIHDGRNGKGSIFVWASGNGGQIDDCACDGYASSIYTFTVSAASPVNDFPWYGEHCSSTIASTYSSGTSKQNKIATIDPQNMCTSDHTGTSASAPIAAGIVALMLQANPSLTWREVQHLTAWTANPVPLFDVSGWLLNGAGLWSSPKFGFGLMDAFEMTKMAKNFHPLGRQQNCTTTFPNFESRLITNKLGLVLSFKLNGCKKLLNEIRSLEQVQVVADIESDSRGLLSIWLESPSGMRSHLLHPRMKDTSTEGFNKWPFTSVQFWGENPEGLWKLHVDQTKVTTKDQGLKSTLKNVTIILYGTTEIPSNAKSPKQYQNATQLPRPDSTFASNEELFDITDIENTIHAARQSLAMNMTEDNEKHLLAVDRLVRSINRMNRQTNRRRRFSHLKYTSEV